MISEGSCDRRLLKKSNFAITIAISIKMENSYFSCNSNSNFTMLLFLLYFCSLFV